MVRRRHRRGWRVYARLAVALTVLAAVALPGYYNRRDIFSHWVRQVQQANRPCGHACCRGMRAHPGGYPVVKRNRYLRTATDQQVADYYGRHGGDSPRDEAARDQALAEMDRRDRSQERREATEERRRTRWASRREQRALDIEREWRAAEAATRRNMLNRRGREVGVSDRSLFTGPESRVRKYGSEELLNWFEDNPRLTEAYHQGRDTRIGYGPGLRRPEADHQRGTGVARPIRQGRVEDRAGACRVTGWPCSDQRRMSRRRTRPVRPGLGSRTRNARLPAGTGLSGIQPWRTRTRACKRGR